MAMYNNDARKKQKKTVAVDNGGDSSLLIPVVVVPCSALSFGNILKEFPDFLFCLLSYVGDRVIWNSIASSNKDIHAKSKAIRPPWPLYYKLPPHNCFAWSPCGTRIAYEGYNGNSYNAIIDQRRGPYRNNGNNNNDLVLLAHDFECDMTDLKFSPDGSYLVSAYENGCVRLWDNVNRNYELIQEWDMKEEAVNMPQSEYIENIVSISACSKYIVVSVGACVFLKDVEGKTIKSILPPIVDEKIISKTMFSSNGRAIFICCNEMIQVWRPYLDDDDEDHLITLWRQTDPGRGFFVFTFSHDTMVVIHNFRTNTGTLLSIDTDHKCLTKKIDVQGSTGLRFTPDGKYILVNKENGPTLCSIAEGKYTNKTIHFLGNRSNCTKHNKLVVMSFSPDKRQCIVKQAGSGNRYITSYFMK